jgi:hypothetical protein
MRRELKEEAIERLLNEQIIGRIGCHADGITYVVPVTYAYDGEYIYVHSEKGMKTAIMQKNPDVCFQVDEIRNLVTWWSVIAWGHFEEIHKEERDQAMKLLTDHIMSLLKGNHSLPAYGAVEHAKAATRQEAIWYRIKVNKKTGRCEVN